MVTKKYKIVAIIIALTFGIFGGQYFYINDIKKGLLSLLLLVLGIGVIINIINAIIFIIASLMYSNEELTQIGIDNKERNKNHSLTYFNSIYTASAVLSIYLGLQTDGIITQKEYDVIDYDINN